MAAFLSVTEFLDDSTVSRPSPDLSRRPRPVASRREDVQAREQALTTLLLPVHAETALSRGVRRAQHRPPRRSGREGRESASHFQAADQQ